MKRQLKLILTLIVLVVEGRAQNVSTRSNNFEVDLGTKGVNSTVPMIKWIYPPAETNFSQGNTFKIKFEVESISPLKSVMISIKENPQSASRGSTSIQPTTDSEKYKSIIEKNLTLMEGNNIIEVVAENMDGVKSFSERSIRVGSFTLSDAAKLDRTDYALIVSTNDYDNWPDLINPVNDGRAIADELRTNFGFKVDIIENGSQSDILKKLREYGEKKYKPLDQLFIFFAGHGQYDQTFGEGYVVTKESMAIDEAKTSYLSYNRLRSIVNNIPCEHIFLAMDVCFGGTFDATLAHRGLEDEVYKEVSQADLVIRKLTHKTRRYLTSGGKEYVPDGRPGMNSPFARKFLEALRGRGGKDLILTLGELNSYVEALNPQPRAGEFGDNAPGSDFVFVIK